LMIAAQPIQHPEKLARKQMRMTQPVDKRLIHQLVFQNMNTWSTTLKLPVGACSNCLLDRTTLVCCCARLRHDRIDRSLVPARNSELERRKCSALAHIILDD
jgi:hypothetical protein